jgi:UDP-GlcNAc:undecaprenyl-phosphate GlcNAc-1-phosphate transferase
MLIVDIVIVDKLIQYSYVPFENVFLNKVLIFSLALFISLLIPIFAIWAAKHLGLVDIPYQRPHKTHKKPTPIAGGISLVISLLILFSIRKWLLGSTQIDPYIIGALAVLFLVGIIDDFIILSAKFKLLPQILAAAILVLGNHQVHILDNQLLNILISIIWFVGITNAFNFIDSSDGLLLGTGIIISSFIIFATLNSNQDLLNTLTIAFLGLLVGLFVHNRYPARLFLGDSGSQVIGLIFALLALNYNPLGFDRTTSWISPILMMSFPIFDVSLVVFSRFKRGLPIFQGQLDHTYHRLKKLFQNSKILNLIIFGLTFTTNILGLINLYLKPVFSYLLLASVFILGIAFYLKLEAIYQEYSGA